MEAIKLTAGFGELLTGQLLTMDLRSMQFHKNRITRREGCAVCGA